MKGSMVQFSIFWHLSWLFAFSPAAKTDKKEPVQILHRTAVIKHRRFTFGFQATLVTRQ